MDDNSLWLLDGSGQGKPNPTNPARLPMPSAVIPSVADANYESSDDEPNTQAEVQRSMQALTLQCEFPRYLGKSSRVRFFKQAYDMKQSYAGEESPGTKSITEQMRHSLARAKYIRSQPVRSCVSLVVAAYSRIS